ncbi:hypothetical protein [Candidatus Accumulibacter contiguus]|jgi:hypothetical protein
MQTLEHDLLGLTCVVTEKETSVASYEAVRYNAINSTLPHF